MSPQAPRSRESDATAEKPVCGSAAGCVRVAIGAGSHVGRVRKRNEDHYLVARLCKAMRILDSNLSGQGPRRFSGEEGYLFIVADGMGGEAGGEEASRIAVESVEDYVLNALAWFLHLGGRDEVVLREELKAALLRADRNILRRASRQPALQGMGTTLTLAYSVGTELFLAHAGDCRAYLYRNGQLDQLTRDHTMAQMLVDSGQIAPEEARWHRRRNVVTNVVGGPSAGVYAEFHKTHLDDGDLLLLCSDGLTESVEPTRVARTLAAHADDPKAAARRLIELTLEAGAPDNVTVIVARYAVVSE